jgi:protein tyrosine phosphatase (PTP) superfamily phosphohydrolase (DUF442 family)
MSRLLPSVLVASLLLPGCSRTSQNVENPLPRDHAGLHNVLRVTDKLLSGSSPEGDAGFESLTKLGVRTIITVDGARPDVERARKHGLRYVHLPIGYDGIPREQGLRIARAVRDLPGLVYLHCHHGKHRGPAAAAVVRLCLDDHCRAADAVAFLKEAGTAPHYKGLYAAADLLRPTPAELDAVSDEFTEVAPVSSLIRMMVELDGRWERLTLARRAGWKAPEHHPDVDPPHEAVQLWELYREAARLPKVKTQPESFRRWLDDGERAAKELADALAAKKTADAARAFEASAKACADCHARHRDAPK